MNEQKRAFAVEVVSRLRSAGHLAFWAGGCVRDHLLGMEPLDYDVATDAVPERVISLFRRTVPVGVSFGVVRVIGPREVGEIEVATFRSDGRYLDGRRPESVTFSTPEIDASRRDFTINGMFLDPLSGEVIDYVGGRDDLARGIVRAIGDPRARFAEDKLRLLRAVRFAARLGFAIEPSTRASLTAMAVEVRTVAAERIAHELRRMLVHPSRSAGMEMAFQTGLIAPLMPDLVPLKGFPSTGAEGDGTDLWDHTLAVLARLPDDPSFPLAMAALCHEIGKPRSRTFREGRAEFTDHEAIGREIVEEIGRELRLANDERRRIAWLVGEQSALANPQGLPAARLKRLLATPGVDELLALQRAVALASAGDVGSVEYCEWYRREQPEGPIDPPRIVTGDDLVNHGLRPGKAFASILEQVRDAQLNRIVNTREQALTWIDAQDLELFRVQQSDPDS